MDASCYTYFAIKGTFSPKDITRILNLQPTNEWAIGDLRSNGKSRYDFALWEYGRCDEYEIEIEKQCLKTIHNLKEKISELQTIKKQNDVSFVLEIVPTIIVEETKPAICFNRELIDFCYQTDTDIDIDLYAYNQED